MLTGFGSILPTRILHITCYKSLFSLGVLYTHQQPCCTYKEQITNVLWMAGTRSPPLPMRNAGPCKLAAASSRDHEMPEAQLGWQSLPYGGCLAAPAKTYANDRLIPSVSPTHV